MIVEELSTQELLTEVIRRIDNRHMGIAQDLEESTGTVRGIVRELDLAKQAAETCAWRLERSLETQPQPREALRRRLTERQRDRTQPGN